MKSLVAFRGDHIIIGELLLAVFIAALVITWLKRLKQIQRPYLGVKQTG